jgi:hypothetical protein
MLVEAAAQAPCFDAHDRIEPRIVLVVAIEYFDADRVFLQLIGFAGERALNDMSEKPAHSTSPGKLLRRKNAVELRSDFGWREWPIAHESSMNWFFTSRIAAPSGGAAPSGIFVPTKRRRPFVTRL